MFCRLLIIWWHLLWYIPLIVLQRATLTDLIASLGVFYIKLAQMISTRPDLFPINLILSLQDLQDRVPPTLNLGCCLASGSIAEVYDRGSEVIKIRRPNVDQFVRVDYQIMMRLLQFRLVRSLISALWGPTILEGLVQILSLIESTIKQHLDFENEARNQIRLRNCFIDDPRVIIPTVHQSTKDTIIMEKLNGHRLDQVPPPCRQLAMSSFLKLIYEMIFRDRFVHGDLHEGNILLIGQKIGLLDFGLVHELKLSQVNLIRVLFAGLLFPTPGNIEIVAVLMYLGRTKESSPYREFKMKLTQLLSKPHLELYLVLEDLITLFRQEKIEIEESLITPLLLMATAERISKKHSGPSFLEIIKKDYQTCL